MLDTHSLFYGYFGYVKCLRKFSTLLHVNMFQTFLESLLRHFVFI